MEKDQRKTQEQLPGIMDAETQQRMLESFNDGQDLIAAEDMKQLASTIGEFTLSLQGTEAKIANSAQKIIDIENNAKETLSEISESIISLHEVFSSLFADKAESSRLSEAFSSFINMLEQLPQIAEVLRKYKEQGVLDAAPVVAQWLKDNGYEQQEPEDSLAIIFGATRRAITDKKNMLDLLPAFKEKAEAALQQGAQDITIYDLLRSYSTGQYDIDSPIAFTTIKAEKLLFPLDTVNAKIWQALEPGTLHPIKAEKDGSKQQLSIYYSIDFDALGKDIAITQELTRKDKRIYIAAAASAAETGYTTLTKIHEQMGNTGRPSAEQLAEINDLLTKMGRARITVNNKEEAGVYHYPHFVYDGALLPFERVSAIVNGRTTEAAIHLLREPPLITFARQRKQVTTIDAKLLQSPISKTPANLAIDDYLIERISRATGKQKERILYKTLYEKTGVKTAKQKQRTPDKIKAYLDHYKKCGFITGYSMEADGVTVQLKQATPGTSAKKK